MVNDLENVVSVDKGKFIYVGKLKEKQNNSLCLTDVLTLSSKIVLELTNHSEWSYKRAVSEKYKSAPDKWLDKKAYINISKKTAVHYFN